MKPIDLATELPRLLPLAIAWVKRLEKELLESGRPLTDVETLLAAAVAVRDPVRVRIKIVQQIPRPSDPTLRAAADQAGLVSSRTSGITFGHGIYICAGHVSNRLVSHELRHVHQYEEAGTIDAFLGKYLKQIVTVGYDMAPLERDARLHERDNP